jgi:sterol desaturase/sphingolipid hydroxylase (fatty acid hydroxylase superfamily)
MFDRLIEAIRNNPTTFWVAMFLLAGLVTGIVTGFFRMRKIQPGPFKWKQLGTEVLVMFVGFSLTGLFLGGLSRFLESQGWVAFNDAPAAWWVILLEYAAFFFLFDTWFYWFHRLMHKEPIYTVMHKWHHYSTAPTVITTFSVNPLESLVNGGFLPLFTAAVTLHSDSMAFIGPTQVLMGIYVHAGYEFLPRWWNKSWVTKWFITTTFHDQHHKYFNYNYGGFTTIWDYVCGTVRKNYEQDFANPKARRLHEERKRAKATVGGPPEVPAATADASA